jgi:hypothetical protein
MKMIMGRSGIEPGMETSSSAMDDPMGRDVDAGAVESTGEEDDGAMERAMIDALVDAITQYGAVVVAEAEEEAAAETLGALIP